MVPEREPSQHTLGTEAHGPEAPAPAGSWGHPRAWGQLQPSRVPVQTTRAVQAWPCFAYTR